MSFAPWNLGITNCQEISGVRLTAKGWCADGMAFAQRLYVEEGEDLVALEQLEGWDVS